LTALYIQVNNVQSSFQIFNKVSVYLLQSVRKGKLSFEIQMQDKGFYLFAAECDVELDEWVAALKRVIQSNDASQAQLEKNKDKGQNIIGVGAYF